MKLKKVNVSADSEKVKIRTVDSWAEASAEARRKTKKLAGPNVYRTIENCGITGNISEGAAAELSWGLGISPFYIIGASDEKSRFTFALLSDFLKSQGYDKSFIESYVKYLNSFEAVKNETGLSQEDADEKRLEEGANTVAGIIDLLVSKPGDMEMKNAADNLTEEEVITLMRALMIRSKIHNSNVAELAAQIKTMLLLN